LSLLGLIGQMQDPALMGLLGAVPTLWESDSASTLPVTDNTTNDPTAAGNSADLIGPALPISKSGTPYFPLPPPPYFPPPPQLPSSAPQWLDVARWVTPGLVDYFTKPAPPPAPFPPTPGKIPPADANPYFGPALVDAVNVGTAVLGAGEGIALGLARRLATKAPVLADFGLSATTPLAAQSSVLARPIAQVGQEGEAAVGIPQDAPKPSITITSSGTRRYPDRLTRWTLEEVKNVKYQAFTQQLSDCLEYAEEKGLTFILHARPDTVFSGPLKALIVSGHINLRYIPRPPR